MWKCACFGTRSHHSGCAHVWCVHDFLQQQCVALASLGHVRRWRRSGESKESRPVHIAVAAALVLDEAAPAPGAASVAPLSSSSPLKITSSSGSQKRPQTLSSSSPVSSSPAAASTRAGSHKNTIFPQHARDVSHSCELPFCVLRVPTTKLQRPRRFPSPRCVVRDHIQVGSTILFTHRKVCASVQCLRARTHRHKGPRNSA